MQRIIRKIVFIKLSLGVWNFKYKKLIKINLKVNNFIKVYNHNNNLKIYKLYKKSMIK